MKGGVGRCLGACLHTGAAGVFQDSVPCLSLAAANAHKPPYHRRRSLPPAPALQQEPEYADAPADLIRPEALDEARIEDLIAQHLTHNLEILPENVSWAVRVCALGVEWGAGSKPLPRALCHHA